MSDTTNLTRRAMIGGVAGAGLAAYAGADQAKASSAATASSRSAANSSAGTAAGELTGTRLQVAVRVTRVVARFPIEFPVLTGKPAAVTRARSARVAVAARKLKPQHLARVCAAADLLVADGLLGRPLSELATTIGARSAQDKDTPLTSLVALSIATLAPRNDPNQDAAARLWTGLLASLHQQGALAPALTRRGIR